MATYYWVGGGGTWDATTTTNWSLTSGGAGSAGVPTSADDIVFDANSAGASYRVSINNGVCRNITANKPSAAAGTLTLGSATGNGYAYINGNATINSTGVVIDHIGGFNFRGSGNINISILGGSPFNLAANMYFTNTATYNLQTDLRCGNTIILMQSNANIYANNKAINCQSFEVRTGNGILDFANTSTITANAYVVAQPLFFFQPGTGFRITGNQIFIVPSVPAGFAWNIQWANSFTAANANNTPNIKVNTSIISGTLDVSNVKDLDLRTVNSGNSISANLVFGDVYLNGNAFANMGSLTWSGSNNGVLSNANNTFYSNNKTISFSSGLTINGNTNFKFDTNLAVNDITFSQGNVDIINKSITVSTFTSSTTLGKIINFGTSGFINVTSVTAFPWTVSGAANGFITTGTTNVISSSGINHPYPVPPNSPINFNIRANDNITIAINTPANNIVIDGVTSNAINSTFSSNTSIYGSLIMGANTTLTGNITFYGSTNSELRLTSSGANSAGYSNLSVLNVFKTPGFSLTVNTATGILLINNSTSFVNLDSGTLILNNSNLQTQIFRSTSSNVRQIDMGSKYIVDSFTNTTGAINTLIIGNTGNLTVTGTKTIIGTPTVNRSSKNFINYDTNSAQTSTFNIIAGSSNTGANITFTGAFDDIDLSSHVGPVRFNSNTVMHGNLIFGNLFNQFFTNTGAYADLLFVGNNRTQYFVTSGKALSANVYKNGNGTLIVQNNYVGSGFANGTGNFILNAGNVTFTTSDVRVLNFFSVNTNPRVLTMGTGNWNVTSNWTTTATNFTVNPNTSTIAMTSGIAKTFAGGDASYYILQQSSVGSATKPGDLTITGNNTFYDIQTPRSATQNATIIFAAGSFNVTNVFTAGGVSSNLLNLTSSQAGVTAYVGPSVNTDVSYISFTDIGAARASVFRAYTSNGNINVDGTTNKGIIFTSSKSRFGAFFS